MQRRFTYPESLNHSVNKALESFQLSVQDSMALAKAVRALSDYFIQNPDGATPWSEPWARVAYLSYFLPLNAARIRSIAQEGSSRGFFKELEFVVDFGAGLATASLTLNESQSFKYILVEKASEPQKIVENYFPQLKNASWSRSIGKKDLINPEKTLAVFSYSLTELSHLPEWAYDCEALMLVEPSTQQDGRKLMKLREELQKKGFFVWAPCTHDGLCPLLHQSKTDWCHDRVHFDAPDWFQKMESHLPMKNRTLTMSYLLLRKTRPEKMEAARVVGDRLQEKGKDRQMICQGPEREFLAWLHKNKLEQEIPRGVLIERPHEAKKVSNEIRVDSRIKILSHQD